MLVVYGPMAGLSVGKLFMAAFFPGFLLSALYCVYIVIRSYLEPEIAPPVPREERAVPFLKKTTILIASMVPPMILVLAVLGVIFFGIAAPTEAAAVGAFAATLLTVAYGKFSWKVIKETATSTMRIVGMIMLIVACAVAFVGAFIGAGGSEVIKKLVLAVPGEKWGAFGLIMLLVFIFGTFLDWLGIILIMIPIITPLCYALGFDPIWFAMMICVNLQTSFMTPPFAPAIYNCQGSLSPDLGVTMADIIRGVIPFVILILVSLCLLVAFPEIITWLPGKMIK
jgi:tripartite ATP-independent transporter DctM subunit